MSNINSFDLSGKVIILTGATGFLGTGYHRSLSEAGAQVIGWDNNLTGRCQEGLTYQQVNITDEESVRLAVQGTLEKYGRIDGLVNNAAMNPAIGAPSAEAQFAPYEDYDIDLFIREMMVNVVGTFICIKHVIPTMMRQRSGSVVNVASGAAIRAHNHHVYGPGSKKRKSPAYAASKGGLLSLTRQVAAHLGEYSVRVNALCLGAVRSDKMARDFVERYSAKNMLERMAEAGEYRATLQYLLSDASTFMTGATMVVDGGKSAW